MSEHESYAPFSETINTQLEIVSDFSWLDARKLYSAVSELETTLKELGVSEDEAEHVGALAEYQADLIIDERGQRLKDVPLAKRIAMAKDARHPSAKPSSRTNELRRKGEER